MAFHVDPVQPWTPVHTVPHRNLSWYVGGGGERVAGPFTETVPNSPLSGVNRSLMQYGFRGGAKTLR